jgi:eukaryotic-like serine/threonine-protein kinase
MSEMDAKLVADLIRRLRLVDEVDLAQCLDELDRSDKTAEGLLRILERKGLITTWQSSKLIKGDREGYSLGGYRLLYRIAAGSFGRVFRAVDPATGNIVAVKVLRERWSSDAHKVELFHREGKVGLTLHHPNIVSILAVGKDNVTGKHYIVMEFVEGGNLRDILKIRKKIAPREAVKILEESAAGLAYAHSRGLSHRDIKPTNILVSSQGVAKLVDFGLAEIAGDGNAGDDETEVDRTVDYAALERATNVKQGDVRSDEFFLGCVFYEMLTGRPPLPPTKDKYQRMSRARYENLPMIAPDEVDAPQCVFQLLGRMTAFHPHERHVSPAQLHEAIRRVQNEMDGIKVEELAPSGPMTVFVVEGVEKIQDALREKLKALGYRVLISQDPARAEQRYKDQPYHGLIMDAGTAGEDGLNAFKHIFRLAENNGLSLGGILLLAENQADWADEIPKNNHVVALTRPLNLRQLYTKLVELVGNPLAAAS